MDAHLRGCLIIIWGFDMGSIFSNLGISFSMAGIIFVRVRSIVHLVTIETFLGTFGTFISVHLFLWLLSFIFMDFGIGFSLSVSFFGLSSLMIEVDELESDDDVVEVVPSRFKITFGLGFLLRKSRTLNTSRGPLYSLIFASPPLCFNFLFTNITASSVSLVQFSVSK